METPSAALVKIPEPRHGTVEFPEKDESAGELILSFVGPAYDNHLDRKVRLSYVCRYAPL